MTAIIFLLLLVAGWQTLADFSVLVPKDHCIAFLLPDGFANSCYEKDTTVFMTNILFNYRSKDVAVAILRPIDGLLLEYQRISIPSDFQAPVESSSQLHSTDNAYQGYRGEYKILLLWPTDNLVVTSNNVDVQYYVKNAPKIDYRMAQTAICVVLSAAATKTSLLLCNSTSYYVSFQNLPPDKYHAEVFALVVENDVAKNVSRIIVERDLLPTMYSVGRVSFSVELDQTTLPVNLNKKGRILTVGKDLILNIDGSSLEIIHVSVMSCRSLERYKEAEIMLKSLLNNYRRGSSSLVIHMIVDREADKFFEAVWQKHNLNDRLPQVSLLFHDFDEVCSGSLDSFLSDAQMEQSFHHSGKAGYCRLFLPTYFKQLNTSWRESFGYDVLGQDSESIDLISRALFNPQRIIAIESDQLILDDVTDLWREFDHFGALTLVAASENYQPWNHSRLFAEEPLDYPVPQRVGAVDGNAAFFPPIEDESYHASSSANLNDSRRGIVSDEDHGYGIIGGVMLLDLERMQEIDFLTLALGSIVSFRASVDSAWDARLNDQDIFNVIFSLHPELVQILPCEWNVQLHARINSLIYCHLDMPGRRESLTVNPRLGQPASDYLFFQNHQRRLEDVDLNCAESRRRKIFVCSKKAKILHFMSGTYNNYNFLLYYAFYWDMYKSLSWTLL